jgi:hypothetical protein
MLTNRLTHTTLMLPKSTGRVCPRQTLMSSCITQYYTQGKQMSKQQRNAKVKEALALLDKAETLYWELHDGDADDDVHSEFEVVREALEAEANAQQSRPSP